MRARKGAVGLVLKVLPWLIVAFFAYQYGRLALLNEVQLRNGIDLGTYNQALYNISHWSIPPYNSLKGQVAWGDHAHFILLLIAPLYALAPGPQFVLLFQALIFTTSGWAVYQVAQDKLKNYFFSSVLLVAYLLFFGVQYALDFDFHANVLTAAVLAWSFYAWHVNRRTLFWITVVVGLLTREDAALFYTMFGLWMLLSRFKQRWRTAVALIILSLLYFLVVVYYVMPHWSPGGRALTYFDAAGAGWGPLKIFTWLLSHPLQIAHIMIDSGTKIKTMRYIFQSFGFLPLLSPLTYLMVAPNFAARFLSGEYQRHLMSFHYNVSVVSILAYGTTLAVAGITWLFKKFLPFKRHALVLSSVAAVLLIYGTYTASWRDVDLPLHQLGQVHFTNSHYQPLAAHGALAIVHVLLNHKEQSVAASAGLVPELSDRPKIYYFPTDPIGTADWIVISPEFNIWPLPRTDVEEYIKYFQHRPDYQLIWSDYGIWAFEKKSLIKAKAS